MWYDDNGSPTAIMFQETVVVWSKAIFSEIFWLEYGKHENLMSSLLVSALTSEPDTSRIQSRVLPIRLPYSVAYPETIQTNFNWYSNNNERTAGNLENSVCILMNSREKRPGIRSPFPTGADIFPRQTHLSKLHGEWGGGETMGVKW